MTTTSDVLQTLRIGHKMPAGELTGRLNVGRATLMRAMRALGDKVIVRGKAKRTVYAARRGVRGASKSIPLFHIDHNGIGVQIAIIDPIYPYGCATLFDTGSEWPMLREMQDGWFESLPYFLDDMRPQGFLIRHFAQHHADILQVSTNPVDWSEDDVLHALSLLGSDMPGNYILGETAYRRFFNEIQKERSFLTDEQVEKTYLPRAMEAVHLDIGGSPAGGEFPKFTERRRIDKQPVHVIVKFSGADKSECTQRCADLLICEHLALKCLAENMNVEAATTAIHQMGGRTFLEVQRFDRPGNFGRSPDCSWAALNHALAGMAGKPWTLGAAVLRQNNLIDDDIERDIARVWHFGRLIGNTDMHD